MKLLRHVAPVALGVALAACQGVDAEDDTEADDQAIRTAPAIFTPPERPAVARHPFLLVHAFHASATNDWSFEGVETVLDGSGYFVKAANLPPYAGTPRRAEMLGRQIDETRATFCAARHPGVPLATCLAHTKVNLIGHSQGGLDARYVVGKLGYGDRVATVTTLGAPHRGTPIGDVGLRALDSPLVSDRLANALFELIGEHRTSRELAADPDLRGAIYWLSERRARTAADDIPDDPRVHYEAWAGYASIDGSVDARELDEVCEHRVHGTARRAAKFLGLPARSAHLIPLAPAFHGRISDGHIPVDSAKSPRDGRGWVFRGCVPADHLDLIGRPEAEQEQAQRRTGFKHLDFFRVIAHELASRHGA